MVKNHEFEDTNLGGIPCAPFAGLVKTELVIGSSRDGAYKECCKHLRHPENGVHSVVKDSSAHSSCFILRSEFLKLPRWYNSSILH